MEEARMFTTLKRNRLVPITINPHHINSINLSIIYHEIFEIDIGYTITFKLSQKEHMGLGAFHLHITTRDYENLAMLVVTNMACHCSPVAKLLKMVKHDSRIFHVASPFHVFHRIESTSN